MALTRTQKEQVIEEVQENISGAVASVFVGFNGVTLGEMNELRDKLFESNCAMRVVPKRLLKLALAGAKLDVDLADESGQVAVIWGDDAVEPAKVLHEFAKQNENIRFVAGSLEEAVLTQEQVVALAKLPGRQQLLGQLVSVLQGPARGFAGVLAGVPRKTVYVLQAIKEAKEEN